MHTREMAVEAIAIAVKYEVEATSMASSAKVAREDAQSCLESKRYEYAIRRSRDSIAYSLGIFSDPYRSLTAMI